MVKRKKVNLGKTLIYRKKKGVGIKKATKNNIAIAKKKGIKYEIY